MKNQILFHIFFFCGSVDREVELLRQQHHGLLINVIQQSTMDSQEAGDYTFHSDR